MNSIEYAPLPALPERALVLMIGLPGSGKSTFLGAHKCPVVSTDALREWLFGDAEDQRAPAAVFGMLRKIVSTRLEAGVPQTFVDATNLSAGDRRPLVRLGVEAGVAVVGIWMDTGVDECLERNRGRMRQVAEEVVRRMARRLRPPAQTEGFDHLYRVQNGSGEFVY